MCVVDPAEAPDGFIVRAVGRQAPGDQLRGPLLDMEGDLLIDIARDRFGSMNREPEQSSHAWR